MLPMVESFSNPILDSVEKEKKVARIFEKWEKNVTRISKDGE